MRVAPLSGLQPAIGDKGLSEMINSDQGDPEIRPKGGVSRARLLIRDFTYLWTQELPVVIAIHVIPNLVPKHV
jgi:hypothetical protein